MTVKIFGREPGLWLSGLAVLLTLLVTFNVPGLSAVQAGAIVAVVTAVLAAVHAWKVRPIAPAVFTGLVTTGAALVSTYGLHLQSAQIGAVQAVVVAVLALIVRGHVAPVDDDAPSTPTPAPTMISTPTSE